MKLTDFLQDVGRPVAYYPELRKITGSTNATILLCQFIYWRGKESDPEGWLYKTSDDIQSETGLSYGEQKTARRDLVEAGLLAEHYARLDHQMKFKLNLDTINDKWGKPQTDIPESGKPTLGNDAKPLSLNESEITAENTTKPVVLTEKEKQQVNAKVDAIIANGQNKDWTEILHNFERVFGFGDLPWYSTGAWEKFAKWIIKTGGAWFSDYVLWRNGEGKYKAFSNKKIRENPAAFMDTGYPEYEASKMYRKTDEDRGVYAPQIGV